MCYICNSLGMPGFCTDYSELLCDINSNYACDEILPTLLTLYEYLKRIATSTKIVDIFPLAVNGRKVCPHCGWEKNVSDFSRNRSKRDGLNTWCNECKSAFFRIYHLKKTYNMTPDEVLERLCNQKHSCASDGAPINLKTKEIHHDKETGEVYGLLCHNCNSILAFAHHDYRILLKCLLYQASLEGIDSETLRDFL